MAEQRSAGMTILGVVAIIAIVGLVLLFTKTSATGEVAGVSKAANRYVPHSVNAIQSECDWPAAGVTILGEDEQGCSLVACNEDKLPTGGFNPGNIKRIC